MFLFFCFCFVSEIPDGNFDSAVEEFDNLGLKNVKPLSGDNAKGQSGETDDGRRVIVRDKSRDGRPTIQVTVDKANAKGVRTVNEVRFGQGSGRSARTGSHISEKFRNKK